MHHRKILLNLFGAGLLLALAGTTASTCWLYGRVRELEEVSRTGILPVPEEETPPSASPSPHAEPEPPEVRELRVKRFNFNQERGRIELALSMEPDMSVLRNYVSVDPAPAGGISYNRWTRWNWESREDEWIVALAGEFAYRTNLTLRVRRGLPFDAGSLPTNVVGRILQEDYEHAFSRPDRRPSLAFAKKGRYLPATARRAIAVESVNVDKLQTWVFPVPPANIVPILGFEAGEYNHIYASGRWGDDPDEFISDLAGEAKPVERTVAMCVNESVTSVIDLGSSNGVYLVRVNDADERSSAEAYRAICVTDLGITARRTNSGIGVWVTSLTQGLPVENAVVEVYSSANVLVAKGVSGPLGWCACTKTAEGEPFAVVVSAPDGSDRSFLTLNGSMSLAEGFGGECSYLTEEEVEAFAWTERGIYRHDERIFFHALLRDGTGQAPKPVPLVLDLIDPTANVHTSRTVTPDACGSLSDESFSVDADQPSGEWLIRLRTPGKEGFRILGTRSVKIEEFVPPQIRVKTQAQAGVKPVDFTFAVSAEHLFGGPARGLSCSGAVVFEDAPFAPADWTGWSFGSEDRGLKPSYRELPRARLDANGRHVFEAPIWADTGKPKAAVRIIAQGTVFEDGGRPASSRDSTIAHAYPYYIGSDLRSWFRRPQTGRPQISVACVSPEGTRLAEEKRLLAKLERIDPVYSYKRNDDGWTSWTCEHVRVTVAQDLPLLVSAEGPATFEIPAENCGDYVLTIEDAAADVVFAKKFYLSDWGDETVRAPMANPTAVTLRADKSFYRPGDVPRLVVKSPFAGTALVSVMRDDLVYTDVFALTNATSEIELRACQPSWAPNVNVSVVVVQAVGPKTNHMAARAHGEISLTVRRSENEIPVEVSATYERADDDSAHRVCAQVSAPGATHAIVTLVDEGINLLTGEPTPDPIGYFSRTRFDWSAVSGCFDLYSRLLPVLDDEQLKLSGVKTGGGFGAEMLGRVSPVPTRRFKPLALWRKDIVVKDGKAEVVFDLPEFVGEVRVTAFAYSECAAGAASVEQKVCPKLVMEPDAPRFVAPGDRFKATLPLINRAAADGEVKAELVVVTRKADGTEKCETRSETVALAKDATQVVAFELTAPEAPGQMELRYEASGFGERHAKTIELPVRPAVSWEETSGVVTLAPGEGFARPVAPSAAEPVKFAWRASASPVMELADAYQWLADYPHGCLEQTTSRIFPLLAADAVLEAAGSIEAKNRLEYVRAGVSRVTSMLRANDFVMWPDCSYAPWDREVSLYAAHFLVEAERSGVKVAPRTQERVMSFLNRWSHSSTNRISAYACHTLALAGKPNRDRMLRLYDNRAKLTLLDRARLARAFVAGADRTRAEELLANAASPASVVEAAFLTLALLDLDANDARLPTLVTYLLAQRQDVRPSWGTTGENAHALLALGAWYRAHPPADGKPDVKEEGGRLVNTGTAPAFLAWWKLALPKLENVKSLANQLKIERDYLTAEGEPYDLTDARCGDLVIVRLRLWSDVARDYNDLVIEDLFPGAFEPVQAPLSESAYPWFRWSAHHWVMRKDARDDRMLVYSKKFHLEKKDAVTFHYPVRVVSTGTYALPGVAVEAMYQPELRARTAADRLVVRD